MLKTTQPDRAGNIDPTAIYAWAWAFDEADMTEIAFIVFNAR